MFHQLTVVILAAVLNPFTAYGWIHPKSLETRFVSYLHTDPLSEGSGFGEGHLLFEGRRQWTPALDAFVQAEVWADNHSLSSGAVNQIHDRKTRRPNVNLPEAYVEFRGARADLRFGKQKISWGKSDGFNPTDVFGAFDYADLLNPERLGVAAVRAFYYARDDATTIEGVCRPSYSPSRAGRFNTRWRPLLENGAVPVPADVRFPANHPSNADYGLKVSRRLSDWDVSTCYARVIDDVAGNERIAGVIVRPIFLKKRIVGFDASRTIDEGQWEIHAEAAYTSTPSGHDDDFLLAVAGGRRAFTEIYRQVDLDLTVECAWEHVYSRHKEDHVIGVNRVQRPFPGSVLVRAVWDWTEFVSWTVKGAYTVRGADAWFVTNELAWRVSDLLELRAGFDAIAGSGGGTTAALYEDNDRWYAGSTIYFR